MSLYPASKQPPSLREIISRTTKSANNGSKGFSPLPPSSGAAAATPEINASARVTNGHSNARYTGFSPLPPSSGGPALSRGNAGSQSNGKRSNGAVGNNNAGRRNNNNAAPKNATRNNANVNAYRSMFDTVTPQDEHKTEEKGSGSSGFGFFNIFKKTPSK